MNTRWILNKEVDKQIVENLSNVLGIDENLATLLVQRGITNYDEAKDFFRPSITHLHDPFLMKDMDKAVSRILTAVENGEKIVEWATNIYTSSGYSSSNASVSFEANQIVMFSKCDSNNGDCSIYTQDKINFEKYSRLLGTTSSSIKLLVPLLLDVFNTGQNEVICNTQVLEDYIRTNYGDSYKYISSTTKRFKSSRIFTALETVRSLRPKSSPISL